ncbi:MAG: NAD(P)H-dependent oxidoreductase [Candidatus Devosia euplotis]|nr:NAD(P)H-dependent oxidoreductase [Candidatus Devosia euplotis]
MQRLASRVSFDSISNLRGKMKTALALSGSIRAGSRNLKLQAHMGRQLEAAGSRVNAINMGDFDLPIFNEDLEPEGAVRLAELRRSHDIIFIATPEYNGGLPPLLVNAATWVSRQRPSLFRRAIFGIGGVSSGKYDTIWSLSHLRDSLSKVGGRWWYRPCWGSDRPGRRLNPMMIFSSQPLSARSSRWCMN